MFWVTIAMDAAALLLMLWLVGSIAAALTAAYILASRAYSWRKTRLKKHPIIGFLTVTLFQGPVIFALVILAATGFFDFSSQNNLALVVSFLLLGAGYPLTQIYQHKQDGADGVKTLSMLLGIKGTFVFSGVLFALLGATLFSFFFFYGDGLLPLIIMALALAPVGYIFTRWMFSTFKNPTEANFENTMKMNKWGSLSLNLLFLLLAILKISAIV